MKKPMTWHLLVDKRTYIVDWDLHHQMRPTDEFEFPVQVIDKESYDEVVAERDELKAQLDSIRKSEPEIK